MKKVKEIEICKEFNQMFGPVLSDLDQVISDMKKVKACKYHAALWLGNDQSNIEVVEEKDCIVKVHGDASKRIQETIKKANHVYAD